MATEKVSQVQMFTEIRAILKRVEGAEKYVDYMTNRINLLIAQSERAKARKAAKEKPEDLLKIAVAAQMGDMLKTGDEVLTAIKNEFPDATKAKVIARLTALANEGVVGKMQLKIDGGKRVMAYALKEYMPADDEE